MDAWYDGIPTVAALAAATIGAGSLALLIARAIRLSRWLGRISPDAAAPDDVIDRMATLADIAKREGLLHAEAMVDAATDPILAEGLMLTVNGFSDAQIQERLDTALQTRAARATVGRRWLGAIGRWPAASVIPGAAILLAVMLDFTSDPAAMPAFLSGVAVLAFLALTTVPAVLPVSTGASSAAAALSGLFQVLTVSMIRAGCGGAEVRRQLTGYLPASQRSSDALAQAA